MKTEKTNTETKKLIIIEKRNDENENDDKEIEINILKKSLDSFSSQNLLQTNNSQTDEEKKIEQKSK